MIKRAAIIFFFLLVSITTPDAFELFHADFHGHLAQKIYVQTGKVDPDVALKVMLTSDKGLTQVIHQKTGNLKPEEIFILNQKNLPSAQYTISVELLKPAGKVVHQISERFQKSYNGIPKAGIDERNNICVDGKPFFVVAPFFVGRAKEIQQWDTCINTLKGVGFMEDRYTVEGWMAFLDLGSVYNKKVIGPLRGYYWPHDTAFARYQDVDGKYQQDHHADIDKIGEYINSTKDHDALLMWAWKDEPDLGGKGAISPGEVRRWTEKCHELDPHHLVFCNFTGYPFTHIGPKYPENNWHQKHIKKYCYLTYSPELNEIQGKHEPDKAVKRLVADVYSMDYYPIEYAEGAKKKGYDVSIEDMCLAMDRMRAWNHDLAPIMAYVETCDIKGTGTPPPTPEQLRLLIWANIIHGAKGISWFHYFKPTPPENFKVMARFLDQITRLTPVVLGNDFSEDVQTAGNKTGRIDIMAKESQGKIFLFAVNLKEQKDKVAFTIEGMVPDSEIEVFDEQRKIKSKQNSFSDEFDQLGVHIYIITR